VNETNPLFEAAERPSPWWRYERTLDPSQSAMQRIRMASATPPATSASSVSPGEGLVIDIESSGTALEASLRLTAGEVLQIVLDMTGYPEQASTWSSADNQIIELPTSDVTAFSNVEAIRSAGEPKLLQHLLHYLRFYFRPEYGSSLASRIETLAQLVRSDTDGAELSGWSVAYLIGFLEKNYTLLRPKLAASPNGEIIAFWRHNGAEFSARFLPNGSVRFLVTVPSPNHPGGVSRSSGDTTLSELFARAGLADLRWMTEAA